MDRNTGIHRNPSAPVTMNAGRQLPERRYTQNTMNGASAAPTEEPLSKSATAHPLSRRGNHSATALVAPGQLADSPAPSRNRKPAKLRNPIASEDSMAAAE